MLLVPTSRALYNPLQGASQITSYTAQEVRRRLVIGVSPNADVLKKSYVQPVKRADGRNISGKEDTTSFAYEKGVDIDTLQIEAMGADRNTLTKKSPLGLMLDKTNEIKENYNLYTDRGVSAIPQADIFSFFNLTKLIKYIMYTPAEVRDDIILGAYTDIRVFPVLKTSEEKTFISSRRLLEGATDLIDQRVFIEVPKIDSTYFNQRYNGVLFKD